MERRTPGPRSALAIVRRYGIEPIVAVNVRAEDPPDEIRHLLDHLHRKQVEAGAADVYGQGGEGAVELAERIMADLVQLAQAVELLAAQAGIDALWVGDVKDRVSLAAQLHALILARQHAVAPIPRQQRLPAPAARLGWRRAPRALVPGRPE